MSIKSRYPFGPSIVLNEIKINEEGPVYVKIQGSPATLVLVLEDRIHFERIFSRGRMSESIPIRNLGNLGLGYVKPTVFLVLSALMGIAFGGLMAFQKYMEDPPFPSYVPFIPLGLCILSLIIYDLSKKTIFYVIASSGEGFAIPLKKIGGMDAISQNDMKYIENMVMRFARSSR